MLDWIKAMYSRYEELVNYVLFGGLTTLVTWGTYVLFVWMRLGLNGSNILSWVCGVIFAFVVNKWFVFRSHSTETKKVAAELTVFVGSRILTGVIAILLFPVLVDLGLGFRFIGTNGLLAKIITSVVEIILNYVFSKYIVFKKRKNPDEAERRAAPVRDNRRASASRRSARRSVRSPRTGGRW